MIGLLVPALVLVAAITLAVVLRPQPLAAGAVLVVGLCVALVAFQHAGPTNAETPSSPSGDAVPSNGGRFRLEVTLKVDGRPVTGSVVQEFTLSENLFPGGAVGYFGERIRAQALVLDLPGRPTFLALLLNERGGEYTTVFPTGCFHRADNESVSSYLDRIFRFRGTCELSAATSYPQFASIADKLSPQTIKLAYRNDLAANFGAGVEFVSARYVATTQPVSVGIGRVFPWLNGSAPLPIIIPRDRIGPQTLFRQGVDR
jgi:hypothetical protein